MRGTRSATATPAGVELDVHHPAVALAAHAPAQALFLQPVEQARHRAGVDRAHARQLGHGVGVARMDLVQRQPLRQRGAAGIDLLVDALRQRQRARRSM
jgi:hypothetical protein